MELIKAVALALKENSVSGTWPEGATECDVGSTTIEFDVDFDILYGNSTFNCCVLEDIEHLPYKSEYDCPDTITKEEFDEWLAENPKWYEDLQNARQKNAARIAELNKQIAANIDELTALSEEAGLPVNIDLGQHGSLDPNSSDWLESRC
jgi:hypothetical protein